MVSPTKRPQNQTKQNNMENIIEIKTNKSYEIPYIKIGTIGYLKRGDKIHECRVIGHEFRKNEYGRGIIQNQWQVAGCGDIILDADCYQANGRYMHVYPTIQGAKEGEIHLYSPDYMEISKNFKDNVAFFNLRDYIEEKYGCGDRVYIDHLDVCSLSMYHVNKMGIAERIDVPMRIVDDGFGGLSVEIDDFEKYGKSKDEALEKHNYEIVNFEKTNAEHEEDTMTFEVKIKKYELDSFDKMTRSANIEVRRIS